MHTFDNQRKLEVLAENIRAAHKNFNTALDAAREAGLSVQYYRSANANSDYLQLGEITKRVTYEHKF